MSDKVSEKLCPRLIVVSGCKRHFPQELAILSKSATQYVIQSLEKNAFKNLLLDQFGLVYCRVK